VAYGDLIEGLREGLAVSAEHDESIMRGIRQAARQLLKVYDFRQAVKREIIPVLAATDNVDLPADVGKIKIVQLTTVEGVTKLYKVLKRRSEGMLPTYAGPNFYFIQGQKLFLDQPMPAILATPYNIELWHYSLDIDQNESWLSTVYEDALEHLAGVKLALKKRKKEAADIYGSLWQQDSVILARHTAELNYSDMDMGMGEPSDNFISDRYPAQ
jgi:hypothetical protein